MCVHYFWWFFSIIILSQILYEIQGVQIIIFFSLDFFTTCRFCTVYATSDYVLNGWSDRVGKFASSESILFARTVVLHFSFTASICKFFLSYIFFTKEDPTDVFFFFASRSFLIFVKEMISLKWCGDNENTQPLLFLRVYVVYYPCWVNWGGGVNYGSICKLQLNPYFTPPPFQIKPAKRVFFLKNDINFLILSSLSFHYFETITLNWSMITHGSNRSQYDNNNFHFMNNEIIWCDYLLFFVPYVWKFRQPMFWGFRGYRVMCSDFHVYRMANFRMHEKKFHDDLFNEIDALFKMDFFF